MNDGKNQAYLVGSVVCRGKFVIVMIEALPRAGFNIYVCRAKAEYRLNGQNETNHDHRKYLQEEGMLYFHWKYLHDGYEEEYDLNKPTQISKNDNTISEPEINPNSNRVAFDLPPDVLQNK